MSQSWYEPILKSFEDQAATWFIGALIALLTAFSSRIVESVKFALNRADLRAKNYEELSIDLSEFVFSAELNHEFLANDWTTRETLTGLIKEYNDSITKIRKKEYVYSAWIEKYWGKKYLRDFSTVMGLIKAFDKIIHSLNDEFESVNIKKTKEKVDHKRAQEVVAQMGPKLDELKAKTHALLTKLR